MGKKKKKLQQNFKYTSQRVTVAHRLRIVITKPFTQGKRHLPAIVRVIAVQIFVFSQLREIENITVLTVYFIRIYIHV